MFDTLVKDFNNNFKKFTNNDIIYAVIALVLAMYGPRLQPKLPEFFNKLFNNNYFRFSVILLIAYLSNKNLQLSLIIAIAFCLVLSLVNSYDIKEKFNIDYNEENENYADYGIITNKENYLPNNEPDNYDTQILKIQSNNNCYLDEHTEIPEDCKNEVYEQNCINYCYSKAGFNDKFCNKKFPQPEITELTEPFEQKLEEEIDQEEQEEQEEEVQEEIEQEQEIEEEIEEDIEENPKPKQACGLEDISYSYLNNSNNILNTDEVNESFINYFDTINNNVSKQINRYKNPLIFD